MSAPGSVPVSVLGPGIGALPAVDTRGAEMWPEVHVVFSGHCDLPWLRLLKPGFRHCFVLLGNGSQWITIDPLSCWMDVTVQPVPGGFDLPNWYRDQGLRVLRTGINRTAMPRPAPWAAFTCVEAVKRVLGIRNRTIVTPYRLYRHLGGAMPNVTHSANHREVMVRPSAASNAPAA